MNDNMALDVKKIIIILSLVSFCFGEEHSMERGHHHHKYLFFTKIAYLVFLGLKIKAILIIGSVWGIALLFGKMFALFKLLEYSRVKENHSGHHDKIVYASPHEPSFIDSPAIYGKSHEAGPSFPPDVTFNHPPSSDHAEFPPPDFPDIENDIAGPSYDSPVYGRSNQKGIYYDYVKSFARVIKKMNTTESAFNIMHLKTDECKKKFVCETEFNIKQSSILATVFDLLSDECYEKYKMNYTLTDINDCSKLYPKCHKL